MNEAMNAEEMIESVLSGVEGESLEQALHGNKDQLIRYEKLRGALDRLVDDGAWFEHPPDLAARTVSFVARNRRRPLTLLEQVSTRLPFRWADFAVAASIFVAGVLTLLPAIQRSRERMNQAGCVFNLQQLGISLAQYATMQASLPYPPSHRSDTHAGMFAVMLHDAGVLKDLSVLDCPCNGPCPHVSKELAGFEQVDHIRRTNPEKYRPMLCWDYAYNLGYRPAAGAPVTHDLTHSASMPVLADSPDHVNFATVRDGNSPNHGGRGQNVLFGDSSVHFLRTRRAGPHDPDIFLNNERKVGPGVHLNDAVLVPSKVPFRGSDTAGAGSN
jgi:hypothetical protein